MWRVTQSCWAIASPVVWGRSGPRYAISAQKAFPSDPLQFEGYEVAMIDGKIAFSAGSTVPTLEASSVTIPPAHKEVKHDEDADGAAEMVAVKTEPGISSSLTPQLITKPSKGQAKPFTLPGSLFVGDLRLTAIKSRLASLSIPAEFAGEGVLICGPGIHQGAEAKGGSIVAVRKMEGGRIVLEGGVGKVYSDVRRELYGGFARVAAT